MMVRKHKGKKEHSETANRIDKSVSEYTHGTRRRVAFWTVQPGTLRAEAEHSFASATHAPTSDLHSSQPQPPRTGVGSMTYGY